MTPTEKAIAEVVHSLEIAVSDLVYAHSAEVKTRRGVEGESAPLRELEAYLGTAEKQLQIVRSQLAALGVRR